MAEIILNKGFKKLKYINVFCTFSEGRQDKFVVKTVCVSGCLKFYVTYTVHERHEGKVLKVDHLSVVLEKELDMLEISRYMRSWEKTKDTQTVYHALAEYGQSVAVRDSIISMLQVNHSAYFWFRRCSNSGHYFIIALDFATGKELMQSEWAIKWDVQSHCMIDSFTFVFSNQVHHNTYPPRRPPTLWS
ncbi:uncharacterized protein LOC134528255 [Bacillus rossius redtenbacheri]|uniref:uncharacterized protein LOC134528255 n=1 Tax=Bacillus rossius redtenbacheri TaxID=93214 RepID=UPI002FDD17FF